MRFRVMTVVALVLICSRPAPVAADPLQGGLYDFSITYPTSSTANTLSGFLGQPLNESVTVSGRWMLDGGTITSFNDAMIRVGSGPSLSLGTATGSGTYDFGAGGLNISGTRILSFNYAFSETINEATAMSMFRYINPVNGDIGLRFAANNIDGENFVATTSYPTSPNFSASLTPVPEINGSRLSLALFVLFTLGLSLVARRRRSGTGAGDSGLSVAA